MTPGKQKVTSASGYDITPLDDETRARLAAELDEEAYRVLIDHGPAPAFC